jgi:hypothetical protein
VIQSYGGGVFTGVLGNGDFTYSMVFVVTYYFFDIRSWTLSLYYVRRASECARINYVNGELFINLTNSTVWGLGVLRCSITDTSQITSPLFGFL